MAKQSEPCINGGDTHAWQSCGLDINADDVLVTVRQCVWCHIEQEKPYGAGGSRSWRQHRKAAVR